MTNTERVINVLLDLLRGEALTAEDLALKYQVTARTVQRDLRSLRDLLAKNELPYTYQRSGHSYALTATNQVQPVMVLAILKMVLGTRALGSTEIDQLLTQLLSLLAPAERSQTKKLCATTINQYVAVDAGKQALLPKLQQFADWIETKTTLTFQYQHADTGMRQETGLPISLYFDTFYFYIVMYNTTNPHRVYRLDRFVTIKLADTDKIHLDYQRKLDEGVFNNKTYLTHGGNDVVYRFRYWAHPQTALDKLPHSRLIKAYADGSVLIEAESFEQGALLWILSQGPSLQIISPPSLIDRVKETYTAALARYQ
ncbi:helix-turn-helix transcriptional regulator [Lactiplantibacillus daowaiensis]|uniref:Helix-turn-helix transcriptional regulator n=1 Tax=Lactiplantibacillus daowaiensis TaxID=2559918 RepID=A0ABW1RXU7_9LACO|nr:WYL domain-containing protein [Lactiplantibacillus daowaiensis]